ncbi:MAG: hypothetical protein MUE44_23475 [Oscillatoriaceae cyanobacterium Prado104]|nr:hypothetical protein [Oscillatoriaceae cyanobacterium Prado104]
MNSIAFSLHKSADRTYVLGRSAVDPLYIIIIGLDTNGRLAKCAIALYYPNNAKFSGSKEVTRSDRAFQSASSLALWCFKVEALQIKRSGKFYAGVRDRLDDTEAESAISSIDRRLKSVVDRVETCSEKNALYLKQTDR